MRVISVVGFLGSGKTTTIAALARHLTSQHQRVAFLINDIGEVQIDGAIIRAGGHEVVEIYGGCLCLMRDDLYVGLADLAQIPDLKWVIIEPSGMADAERLSRLLECFPRVIDAQTAARYRLQCRLSIVDAARYRLLMRSVPQLVRSSIRIADVVLLNKMDVARESDLPAIEAEVRKLMRRGSVLNRVSAREGLQANILQDVLADRLASV
ncbi:MAG: CobW family GTP-binding protein [Gammaproteobacteria bacterium]